ncbi:MAG: MBOAT family O-acyltransferase [Phascolarctobacterium sp.]|nr:MBOAT family O-acyltransferase [Phascolarctobacterium sp.]
MQFNSYFFIMCFMPTVFVGYFLINKYDYGAGKIFLAIMSAVSYCYVVGIDATLLLTVSIFVNFFLGDYIVRLHAKARSKASKWAVIAGVSFNVFLLIYFKYTNFLIDSYNQLAGTKIVPLELFLPLGISFFTFQQIMYLAKVFDQDLQALPFGDYLLYILYFPKLLMGPITEPELLVEQFADKTKKSVDVENVVRGLKIFSYGLAKKTVLADTFALAVNWGFKNINEATSLDLMLVSIAYTFQIYFDFSGYCDMAVGASKMLNIELPMNFDSPYIATSIGEFWKRWHISLTKFLTHYVYVPLGGNRKGNLRTYVNMMIVFLISGLWHGANWTFVLWGGIHGVFSVLDKIIGESKCFAMKLGRGVMTFAIVNVLWLLFRCDSIKQWITMLGKIVSLDKLQVSAGLMNVFIVPEAIFVFNELHLYKFVTTFKVIFLVLFFVVAFVVCLWPGNNYRSKDVVHSYEVLTAALLFVWGFICLSSESVFVYFGF